MLKKRCAAAALAALLLCACSRAADDVPEFVFSEKTTAATTPTELSATEPTAEPTDEPAEEVSPVPAGKPVLLTSSDPLHRFQITFDGGKLFIEGVYDGEEVTEIILDGNRTIPVYEGERFTAELSAEAFGNGYSSLLFGIGGHIIDYRIARSAAGFAPVDISKNAENNRTVAALAAPLPEEVLAEYIGDPERRGELLAQVKELSDTVCEGLTDDYDKLRALAGWVSANIYYDFDAAHTEVTAQTLSLSQVLELHRSVCGGFANLFSALCDAQGITCYNIRGSAINNGLSYAEDYGHDEMHEWNCAVIDGRVIWVDTVWDTYNSYKNGEYHDGFVYFQYFDITEEALALDHRAKQCEHRDFFPDE